MKSATARPIRSPPRYPVEVFYNKAAVGITRDVGRLYGTLSAAVEELEFLRQHVRSTASHSIWMGAIPRLYSTQLRVGYRISPGYDLSASSARSRRSIPATRSTTGLPGLSKRMAGLAFETNPLLRWRMLGGFGVRDYEQAGMENLATSLMEARRGVVADATVDDLRHAHAPHRTTRAGPTAAVLIETGASVRGRL